MTVQKLLLILAVVLFVLLGLAGSGWIIQGHKDLVVALGGWGLAALAGSFLP